MAASNVDLRQILMTDPIYSAANTIKGSPVNRNKYVRYRGEQGFGLPRINRMKEADLNKLLETDPVVLAKAIGQGRKINGKMKQLYTIKNGRHRVARSMAENRQTIRARINNNA